MTLKHVVVVFQRGCHGCQRGVYRHGCRHIVFHETDGHIVFLCLDVKQIVDGNSEVVAPNGCAADGDGDVALLFCRLVEQFFHALSQATVVVNANRQRGEDDADNQRPIQKEKECGSGDGAMGDGREQKEVAEGNEKDQSKDGTTLMPYAPRRDQRM